jgi:hypothetical protein
MLSSRNMTPERELELKTRLSNAMAYADDLCKSYNPDSTIAPEDAAVIDKYIQLGVIVYAKKKRDLSTRIYFPSLMAEEMDGISMESWQRILVWAMKRNGINSNLSLNSAKEYVLKPHEYIPEAAANPDFVTAVWKHSELGQFEVKLQRRLLDELLAEGDE